MTEEEVTRPTCHHRAISVQMQLQYREPANGLSIGVRPLMQTMNSVCHNGHTWEPKESKGN